MSEFDDFEPSDNQPAAPTGLGNVNLEHANLQPLIRQVFIRLKGNIAAYLGQEFAELRSQVGQLDQQLTQRYPEQYAHLKQQTQTQVKRAATHIDHVATPLREQLHTLNPEAIHQQQARMNTQVNVQVGQWGQQVAQQERKIKQYLRQKFQQR